ncbi:hypothetical protein [Humisphaera borealis]|uniref:Uncharacterized protein n=1 Tax=Humisphaera borealis TaxID=2807512 RepID=A0A7M2X007_9BACT|nr:hypothetical protein [Humisphaera borealis]QOV91076.1 hypothetical protein IPV69_06870 [Humisphaera borealis]
MNFQTIQTEKESTTLEIMGAAWALTLTPERLRMRVDSGKWQTVDYIVDPSDRSIVLSSWNGPERASELLREALQQAVDVMKN